MRHTLPIRYRMPLIRYAYATACATEDEPLRLGDPRTSTPHATHTLLIRYRMLRILYSYAAACTAQDEPLRLGDPRTSTPHLGKLRDAGVDDPLIDRVSPSSPH